MGIFFHFSRSERDDSQRVFRHLESLFLLYLRLSGVLKERFYQTKGILLIGRKREPIAAWNFDCLSLTRTN